MRKSLTLLLPEHASEDPVKLLGDADGCALIREGLIIYYHPYHIGCGADGQFTAVIPYGELSLKTRYFKDKVVEKRQLSLKTRYFKDKVVEKRQLSLKSR